ncbi:unnamed protein product [Rotaria sordida]|uniref:Uncharacterized protein n=1 Tax=Rotaria sordida TaxID=392033 RepID=A0A815YKJ0_9BILA|nr:unnamed protein product [Rotaria sordida]CAF1571233.1 unnamed protein product [Rotaria sordida]
MRARRDHLYYGSPMYLSSHLMNLNDGRSSSSSSSSQANYNTHVPTIMPIQQLNIQNLGPGAPSNSQQQQNQSNNSPLDSIINYLKATQQN